MAVDPYVILSNNLNEIDMTRVNELEKDIDNYLIKNFHGEIVYYECEPLKYQVVETIKSRYDRWKVKYYPPVRLGDFASLSFSALSRN